ncbi:hypothetical protein [Cylindrospermopsis raciborskii]|uniref:hypothetical protein n=1 Tax=Cylindrospermopsis raciborskii TaxID=77022 RepID=UPI0021192C87|nr:hypothetical protein [Cylindrospermopsis raciborskii]
MTHPNSGTNVTFLTSVIAEFSGDQTAIAENLKLFLNALLGEYQISYIQPNAERGTLHKVEVQVKDGNKKVNSKSVSYIMPVFGRSLPLVNRLVMVTSTCLSLVGCQTIIPNLDNR